MEQGRRNRSVAHRYLSRSSDVDWRRYLCSEAITPLMHLVSRPFDPADDSASNLRSPADDDQVNVAAFGLTSSARNRGLGAIRERIDRLDAPSCTGAQAIDTDVSDVAKCPVAEAA